MVKYVFMVALGVGMFISSVHANQDPTAPLGWQAPVKKHTTSRTRLPQLQGILCDEQSRCTAILNNKVVSIGGRISGYTLSSIQDESVMLRRGSKQWRLEMFAENIKTH
ncbi:MSHA biogenesis protein MshK [Photobacterium swingsii]|uniref:MSHA biogenesis protein MshK n=2 Tax=Photobacterium swingsii TaxID=680026 RepID=A0A0J8V9Z4_9GAMM|nr:MSHA biogenesis protein MshK [Photobacterium swingsii]PSW22705.1 MSHA biogenesis protein MshK [Photobacterium swingsii]